MKWLLEKTTSAYAIFTSLVLMAGSIFGAFMTLIEDGIVTIAPTPAPNSSSTKMLAADSVPSPSSSSGQGPLPACANKGETMSIIAFLLFGCKCFVQLFCYGAEHLFLTCSLFFVLSLYPNVLIIFF